MRFAGLSEDLREARAQDQRKTQETALKNNLLSLGGVSMTGIQLLSLAKELAEERKQRPAPRISERSGVVKKIKRLLGVGAPDPRMVFNRLEALALLKRSNVDGEQLDDAIRQAYRKLESLGLVKSFADRYENGEEVRLWCVTEEGLALLASKSDGQTDKATYGSGINTGDKQMARLIRWLSRPMDAYRNGHAILQTVEKACARFSWRGKPNGYASVPVEKIQALLKLDGPAFKAVLKQLEALRVIDVSEENGKSKLTLLPYGQEMLVKLKGTLQEDLPLVVFQEVIAQEIEARKAEIKSREDDLDRIGEKISELQASILQTQQEIQVQEKLTHQLDGQVHMKPSGKEKRHLQDQLQEAILQLKCLDVKRTAENNYLTRLQSGMEQVQLSFRLWKDEQFEQIKRLYEMQIHLDANVTLTHLTEQLASLEQQSQTQLNDLLQGLTRLDRKGILLAPDTQQNRDRDIQHEVACMLADHHFEEQREQLKSRTGGAQGE